MELEKTQFSAADYAVFVSTLSVSLGIGVYYAVFKKQNSNREFLLAGQSMTAFPVAMSLLATVYSAIALLGHPTEMYFYGTQFVPAMVGMFLGVFLAGITFLPILYPLRLTSCYEYVELRFHSHALRQLATITYMVNTVLYQSVVLYSPALALSVVTTVPVWLSIVVVGAVCSLYTAIGGIKAVLWTDVFQLLVMIAGILAVAIQGTLLTGGLAEVWRVAGEHGRLQFWNLSMDPFERTTLWSAVIGYMMGAWTVYGCTQHQVQRYYCLKSYRHAQIAIFSNVVLGGCMMLLSFLAGLVTFSVYSSCDPYSAGVISKPDQIIPFFVMHHLGYLQGLPGLFVACIFAGSLSTMSSGLNSLAAVTWEDFIKGTKYGNKIEKMGKSVWLTKALAIWYAIVTIGFSFVMKNMDSILEMTISIVGGTKAPLLGVFLLAAFVPFGNKTGAITGLLVGQCVCIWTAIGAIVNNIESKGYKPPLSTEGCTGNITDVEVQEPQQIYGVAHWYQLSYLLYSVLGCLLSFTIGVVVSLITGGFPQAQLDRKLLIPFVRRFVKTNEERSVYIMSFKEHL